MHETRRTHQLLSIYLTTGSFLARSRELELASDATETRTSARDGMERIEEKREEKKKKKNADSPRPSNQSIQLPHGPLPLRTRTDAAIDIRLQLPDAPPLTGPALLQHALTQAIAMKSVLARKDKKLPTQQRQPTDMAPLARLNDSVAPIEGCDIRLNRGRARSRVIHLLPKGINMSRVVLQSVADLLLEVVDDDKVRKERDQILDANEAFVDVAAVEEVERRLDAAVAADDFPGDGEPEFLAQGGLRIGPGGDE